MKLKSITLILICLFSLNNFAQNIYVCESYSEEGNPIGIINKLETKAYGKAVNVLIDNEKKINSNILYLFIDKLSNGKYVPFDSKILNVDKEKLWAAIKYEFHEAGVYELYFLNASEEKITSLKLEVKILNDRGFENFSGSSGGLGNAQFVFCDMIVNNKPMNPISQLSLSTRNGETYVFINNYSPFSTDKIVVKIWERQENSSEYKELISTKKFKVTPKWSITFFKLTFDKVGDYKIDVNDNNNKLIVSNILTVIN
ncbi:MAG: hypothetical protein WAR79_03735 [Melioribacteraceae bacterium]